MKQTKSKMMQRGAKRTNHTGQSPAKLWAEHLSKALLCSLATGIGLLLIGTILAYFTPNPSDWIPWLGWVSSALTALICGFSMAKMHQHAALLCGLYAGSAWLLIQLLLSFFFKPYASGYAAWLSCILHVSFVICAVIGAYMGIRPSKKRRKR